MASTTIQPILSLSVFRPKRIKSLPPPFATSSNGDNGVEKVEAASDPIKTALAKAQAYKKAKNKTKSVPATTGENMGGDGVNFKGRSGESKEYAGAELEDKKITNKKEVVQTKKKQDPRISNIDFVGLNFSDKKSYRGAPPGLVPVVESIFDGDIPEVEIIVGDSSKFKTKESQMESSNLEEKNADLYKPTVSTWGVFPRPGNISEAFGGGRTIRPGEALEKAEEKAAKEKRTKELIAAYRKKTGLTISPKIKAECQKALEEGDYLMDLGKLKDALPFYEKIMKDVVFQSELHGLAALQWSICQDSLRRSDEARAMYEKLQSHPTARVSKRARQFMFSFQAMEKLKVQTFTVTRVTGYENYFEAFVENKADYSSPTEEQSLLAQSLPYMILLVSPIFFVLFIAVKKSL